MCDCEGALAQILRDNENVIKGIHTVIIENDFTRSQDKEFVDQIFEKYGLNCVYSEPGGFACPGCCCRDRFYQVFKKAQN